MRHYELTEDFATEQTVLNQAKTIRQNCQPYLKQNTDAINRYPMYRGVKPPGGHSVTGVGDANVIRKEVRLTNRKPSDMPFELHEFINNYFQEEYGAPFRSAMFVIGSSGQAGAYGTVYLIFPAGKFEYLWSPEFEDLFSITGEYGYEFASNTLGREKRIKVTTEIKQNIADEVLSTYQTDGLMEAIDSTHEIMIRTQYYYGIHADVMYNKELREKIIEILYK